MKMRLAAGALLAISSYTLATPLVNMSFLGRVAGSGNEYTNLVSVLPGQTVEYQVIVQMAPIGTHNSVSHTGGATYAGTTINSLVANTGVQAGDGLNSLALDIYQNPSDPVQVQINPVTMNADPTPMDNDSWAAGLGSQGVGLPRGNAYQNLIGIRPIHAAGVRTAVAPEVLLYGTFDVPQAAAGPTSFVRLRWSTDPNYSNTSGSGRVNGNETFFIVGDLGPGRSRTGTEWASDPVVDIDVGQTYVPTNAPINLSPESFPAFQLGLVLAPEPGTCTLLAAAAVTLLGRRTRRKVMS